MAQNTHWLKRRGIERSFLLLGGIVLTLLFLKLFSVLERDFEEVPKRLLNGTMINLNEDKPGERVQTLLERGLYFQDPKDIRLIRSIVEQNLHTTDETIDNIGELNKRKYNVNAEQAFGSWK